jgi:predicted Holliday junction resolvase-like endonuclease
MVFLEIAALVLFVLAVFLWFRNREWKIKFEHKLDEWKKIEEEKIRRDAIERSARTLSGKTLEKLVPFLDKFPYDPHDIRWLGDPIDFVIFDGYSTGDPEKIVLCEVKSGDSTLSKNQKKIKEIVENKKIKWEEIKIEEEKVL